MRLLTTFFLAAQVAFASRIPASLQQSVTRGRAELRSQLNSINAQPVSPLEVTTTQEITPAVAADGYIVMTLYNEGSNCAGDPFAYTTFKQSYCYKGGAYLFVFPSTSN